jgi:hypothetical protein
MLIHIVPKLFEPPFAVESEVIDVSIPECGLVLIGGKDITARRPYPNKRYLVACRKVGQKAIDGIFIEVDGWLESYTVATRWLVDGEVITHIVEHTVLDQDFDAVTDSMVLWSGRYGTDWATRWPDCYANEPPVRRQPSMDVLTSLMCGTRRPDGTRDVVDSTQRVILRTEFFQLHTIERERLFGPGNGAPGLERIPDVEQAFIAKAVPTPDMSVSLNNGMTADLILVPMPVKVNRGWYPNTQTSKAPPDVYLTFRRGDKVLASMVPWGTVISDGNGCRDTFAATLSEDDLYEIDLKGWEYMINLGMFPAELILKDTPSTNGA